MGSLGQELRLGDNDSVQVAVLPYGATITKLSMPGKDHGRVNLVLDAPDYTVPHPYFGCVVGRYANRIANGQFALGGRTYQLPLNDGRHTLHGGPLGFSRRVWTVKSHIRHTVTLALESPDGDQGFPGSLSVEVTYAVEGPELRIEYRALARANTILNLTNHSYFNLAGGGTVLDHHLWLDADRYACTDETLIPTGMLAPVAESPFDFRAACPIGARINASHPQLELATGYDHNLVLSGGVTNEPRPVATLTHPPSHRRLTILTTEPGLQVYSGNRLDGALGYPRFGGVALETQHFPDIPNQPEFPSTLLRANTPFRSTTIWRLERV